MDADSPADGILAVGDVILGAYVDRGSIPYGGMAIDPDNPNVIYISTNAANSFDLTDIENVPLGANERYEIWQGTTADGGLTFSWQPVTQRAFSLPPALSGAAAAFFRVEEQ